MTTNKPNARQSEYQDISIRQPVAPPEVSDRVVNKLYDVALAQFARGDFHSIGIRAIRQASGVSSATIYKYFGSKEGLLIAVLNDALSKIDADMEAKVPSGLSAKATFRRMFEVLMRHYDGNHDLAITYFITVPTNEWMESGSWHVDALFAHRFGRIIREARASSEILPSISESRLIGLFYMHVTREVQVWYFKGRKWRLEDTVRRFFSMFWRAIAAKDKPANSRTRSVVSTRPRTRPPRTPPRSFGTSKR